MQKEQEAVLKVVKKEVVYRPDPFVQLHEVPQTASDNARLQRIRVVFAHKAIAWLCRADHDNRRNAPVVADTAMKMALVMLKLGAFTSKAKYTHGPNHERTKWWMFMVAAMKHCGILGTVVRLAMPVPCS